MALLELDKLSLSFGGLGRVGAATTGGSGDGEGMAGAPGLGSVTTGGGCTRTMALGGLAGEGGAACLCGGD